ncbi:MAG: hypothetical protein DHS20C21_22970 [Gemmatimonadota bacterium]|nr:MAG: hypothetical protein DHS20C21_22970 [Gemmatimonadota bacterium]
MIVPIKSDLQHSFPLLLCGVVVCIFAWYPAAVAYARGEQSEKIADTRALIEKFYDTQRLISAERRNWRMSREMLTGEIELLESELKQLSARIAETDAEIAKTEQEYSELKSEEQVLVDAFSGLTNTVSGFERRARSLMTQLPPPVVETLSQLTALLPKDPDNTKQKLPARFLNVCGIFDAVNKFNQEVTVTPELKTFPDGSQAQVTALYIGIGQGYYVSADESVAGYGAPSEEGWRWTPANESAAAIARAIAIVKAEHVAAFVQLPIRIQ